MNRNTSTEPLPFGWVEEKDQYGRTLYRNLMNDATKWARPTSTDQPVPYDSLSSILQSDSSSQPKATAPLSDEGLPEGWSSQLAPNERMFFIDHVNKTTSWVDPRTGCETENPEITEDELGPLPDGWGKRIYADGRVFFVDHNSRLTQRDDPRL